MKVEGYIVERFGQPVKRYVQYLELKDDPASLAMYRKVHSREEFWPEIKKGIKEVGILEMELYMFGSCEVMIVETPIDFDWESAMTRLSRLPRQQEWEDFVARFQQCRMGDTSDEKWHKMERFFYLYED